MTPMIQELARTAGTGGSVVVDRCQVCGGTDLESVLFLGYLPPVNQMRPIGQRPHEQPAYPAELLRCRSCQLVQLGLIVDPAILFPPEYPYTSGTTKILRDNFAELQREAAPLLGLTGKELVVDIGSNDGTLLSNFVAAGHPLREPAGTGRDPDGPNPPDVLDPVSAIVLHRRGNLDRRRAFSAAGKWSLSEEQYFRLLHHCSLSCQTS